MRYCCRVVLRSEDIITIHAQVLQTISEPPVSSDRDTIDSARNLLERGKIPAQRLNHRQFRFEEYAESDQLNSVGASGGEFQRKCFKTVFCALVLWSLL